MHLISLYVGTTFRRKLFLETLQVAPLQWIDPDLVSRGLVLPLLKLLHLLRPGQNGPEGEYIILGDCGAQTLNYFKYPPDIHLMI